MDPSGRDSRYNLNYSMSIGLSMGENPDIYGNSNPALARPTTGLGQTMNRGSGGGLMSTNTQCGPMANSRGIKRTNSDCFDDRAMGSQSLSQLDNCTGGVPDVVDDSYTSLQKKSPPANGKKTKGRVKIKMEYIDNKLRRYTTFSKRKTGIMKKVIWQLISLFSLHWTSYFIHRRFACKCRRSKRQGLVGSPVKSNECDEIWIDDEIRIAFCMRYDITSPSFHAFIAFTRRLFTCEFTAALLQCNMFVDFYIVLPNNLTIQSNDGMNFSLSLAAATLAAHVNG